MSRRDKPSKNLPPFSSRASERYNDTESEAEPADDGDDPLEYDVDRVRDTRDRDVRDTRDVRDRRDTRREVDVDRPRRDPAVSSSARKLRENEFSESDPRQGLTLISRRFLDHNVVDSGFLARSADYLKLHRALSSQSVTEWRERAQCAVRGRDPILARRLIQQAELIKIWRNNDGTIGDLTRGEDSNEFFSFIQKTYTRYLTYLAEAEDEDKSLRRKRGDMLQPWATFVQQVSGEDIMSTFALAPTSDPSTWNMTRPRRPVRPDPADRPRNRPDPSKPPASSRRYPEDTDDPDVDYLLSSGLYRSSRTSNLPYREPPLRDEDKTVTRPFPSSQPTRGPGPRYPRVPREDRDYRDDDRIKRQPAANTSSQAEPRSQRYVKDPSRKLPRDRYEDVEDDSQEDEEQDIGRSRGPASVERRDDRNYPHGIGRVDPDTEPRIYPVTEEVAKTRSSQDRRQVNVDRPQGSTPTKSLSPTSTVATARGPPTGSSQGISEPLKKFIAQQNYQACCDFCKSNKSIFEEDYNSLQNIAKEYIRQGRRDGAMHVIERWLMLRRALQSPEDRFEWMEKLPNSRERQKQLQRECELVFEVLEEASNPPRPERQPPNPPPGLKQQRYGDSDRPTRR